MTVIPRDILTGHKIVLIEDEPDSAEVAARVLRFYGADVHMASNGEEGLALIRTVHPVLIICDISMPVMDGWEVIKTIKNDPSIMAIPAIALTAHAMIGDREKAFAAGFHNYLTKPLTVASFIRDLLVLVTDLPQFASIAEAIK